MTSRTSLPSSLSQSNASRNVLNSVSNTLQPSSEGVTINNPINNSTSNPATSNTIPPTNSISNPITNVSPITNNNNIPVSNLLPTAAISPQINNAVVSNINTPVAPNNGSGVTLASLMPPVSQNVLQTAVTSEVPVINANSVPVVSTGKVSRTTIPAPISQTQIVAPLQNTLPIQAEPMIQTLPSNNNNSNNTDILPSTINASSYIVVPETKKKTEWGIEFNAASIAVLIIVPIIVLIALYYYSPNFICDLHHENGKVVNTTKLIFWVLAITIVILIAIWLAKSLYTKKKSATITN